MPEIITWWLEEGEAKGLSKGVAKGIEVGRQEGIRTSKFEDASKMREHGSAWAIVTDVTGIKPEDLA